MIGVIADREDYPVVREFFELFKTPWEFYRGDQTYEAVLCAGRHEVPESSAKVVVVYGGDEAVHSGMPGLEITSTVNGPGAFVYRGVAVPLYQRHVGLREANKSRAGGTDQHGVVAYAERSGERTVIHVGYSLFQEVAFLLQSGQPVSNAGVPTLDWHISVLRDLLVDNGCELIEIPPVPAGHRFIACLTHDVDHPSIRLHKFDHTMFGFLYRATFGSLARLWEGRITWTGLLRNWTAAAKLPLVQLGICEDFWARLDRYVLLEDGAPSTFYVIPFKGVPGGLEQGMAPKYRASGYGAAEMSGSLRRLMAAGCEIAVHGIDAWRDAERGERELEEVQRATETPSRGVRMHWLYFDPQSTATLDEAGFEYDSTCGYNETVGYRSGTSQVYRPLNSGQILELPLHVMDTALFYPRHLGLGPEEAKARTWAIIESTAQVGGCVTVNWHDRSIAPERLWDDFYSDLVQELKSKGAWFATASQVVSWFRQRRAVDFSNGVDAASFDRNGRTEISGLPALQFLVHNPKQHVPHGHTPRATQNVGVGLN